MPDISNVHAPRPACMYAIYPRSNKNPDIKYIHQHYTLQLEHLIQNDAPQHLGAPRRRKLPAGESPVREIVGSSR